MRLRLALVGIVVACLGGATELGAGASASPLLPVAGPTEARPGPPAELVRRRFHRRHHWRRHRHFRRHRHLRLRDRELARSERGGGFVADRPAPEPLPARPEPGAPRPRSGGWVEPRQSR